MVTIKNKKEIELMREAGRLTADTYEYIGSIIKAGMTSQELNDLAEKFIVSHGGIPAQSHQNPMFYLQGTCKDRNFSLANCEFFDKALSYT